MLLITVFTTLCHYTTDASESCQNLVKVPEPVTTQLMQYKKKRSLRQTLKERSVKERSVKETSVKETSLTARSLTSKGMKTNTKTRTMCSKRKIKTPTKMTTMISRRQRTRT